MQRYVIYLESDDIGHCEVRELPHEQGEWVKADEALARIAELEKFVQHDSICNAKRFCDKENYGSFTKGCTCGLAALFPDRP